MADNGASEAASGSNQNRGRTPTSTSMEVSIDSNMHPLFIHNNDHPGLILISTKLTGSDNYSAWSTSLQISLSAKNKSALIDGSFPIPEKNSTIFPLWARANDMVISWILNVLSEQISNSLRFVSSAFAFIVWSELKERYSNIDGHRVFQLEKDLHRLEQRDGSVEAYYHKMKGLWDESLVIDTITACSCNNCVCGSIKTQETREQRKKLMQFLMGLHDSFSNIRGQILRMKPLPTVGEAYYMVRQEESLRVGYIPDFNIAAASNTFNGSDSKVAANYRPPNNGNKTGFVKPPFKKGIICNYCNKEGHTKGECYRLHGLPAGHPGLSRQPKGGNSNEEYKPQGSHNGHKAMQVSQNKAGEVKDNQAEIDLLKSQLGQFLTMLKGNNHPEEHLAATKILQHLDKMSPKGVPAGEKSPTKLTSNMLHGQALRSMDTLDSSNFLSNAQEGHKSEDLRKTCLPDVRDSTSQKDKVEENGSKMFAVPRNLLAPVNSDATVSGRDTSASVKTADSFLKVATEPPQEKRAFQMSAHEDFLEMDDEIHSNGVASTPLVEKNEKLETSATVSKTSSSEAVSLSKTQAFSESKTAVDSGSNQRAHLVTSNGSVVCEEKTGLTFSSSPPMSPTLQSAALTESTSMVNKFAPSKESNASPSSSISPKTVDKVQPFDSFSANEPSGLKVNSWSDAKPKSFSSLANVASVESNGQVKVPVSDKGDDGSTQNTVDGIRKPDSLPSAVSAATAASSSDAISSAATAPSIFSTGWQPSKSSVFGSTLGSSAPSTGFSFGVSSTSAATTSSSPAMVFGSSATGASSGPSMFSAATTSSFPSFSQTQPVFGNSPPVFAAPSGNNDQMGSWGGGGDKSGRRMVRVSKNKNRKK